MLTVVAGSLGAGKTRWIWEQMTTSNSPQSLVYVNPLTTGIDAHRLLLDVPRLNVETDIAKALQASEEQSIYLELGSLLSLDLPWLAGVSHHRVAVVNPHCPTRPDWEAWADEVVMSTVLGPKTGPDANPEIGPKTRLDNVETQTDIWQAKLQGQVLDPASLHTFWQELVQGAYGQMIRTKAVLELADGQSIYIDHLPLQETTYQDLPGPKWLDGRPQRFSGIEVMGRGLDKDAIAATLKDCCLTDATLKAHQAALKESQAYFSQEAA